MSEPRTHLLKCGQPWLGRIRDTSKTAELRRHDRDFAVGDLLVLYDAQYGGSYGPDPKRFDCLTVRITHILPASVFPEALQPGYSLLSFDLEGDFGRMLPGEFHTEFGGL